MNMIDPEYTRIICLNAHNSSLVFQIRDGIVNKDIFGVGVKC